MKQSKLIKLQVLVDNPKSWVVPYAQKLVSQLVDLGYQAALHFKHKEVTAGDILVLLGCERIFKDLSLNRHNLVVHESALPKGKGWSPLTWQVLEGQKEIPITLFEASEAVDAGVIYAEGTIQLNGYELLPEIKHKQGIKTIDLVLEFLRQYPYMKGRKQKVRKHFYSRRRAEDCTLDVERSIKDQFNLLRVCDNERYPAHFYIDGYKFIVKIYGDEVK